MELLGIIGERSCDIPIELYEDLAKVWCYFLLLAVSVFVLNFFKQTKKNEKYSFVMPL